MATRRQGLSQRRRAYGYSQEALAEQLQVDRTSVGRWERGETDPQLHIRPLLARLLGISAPELERLLFPVKQGTHDHTTLPRETKADPKYGTSDFAACDYFNVGNGDEMIRREFMRLATIASALSSTAGALPFRENIPEAHTGSLTDSHERINANLWHVFSVTASKRAVYPVVREQLDSLTDSLKEASTEQDRRRLCAAAASLFQIAGEIFFDSNRYTDSAHCYSLAASASREADEYDLWACALTRHAFIGMHDRKFATTIPLLDAAAAISRRGDSNLSTRHWVATVQAGVHARVGDLESCRRSLDIAEQVRLLGSDAQNGGWLRFDGSRLAEERGACYLALGRPDLAEAALTEALANSLSTRRRSTILINLAAVGIRRRDVDQVISHAREAIGMGTRTGSGYVARGLSDLNDQLAPLLQDNRLAELSREISTVTETASHH